MQPGDLRALLITGGDGRYWFRTVKPCPDPAPTDGPGGEWLRATGRQPMRPAHIHARVEADGHRPRITHLFVAQDPYSASTPRSASARPRLDFPVQDDPAEIEANTMPGPYFDVAYDLVLVPDSWSPPTS